MKHTQTKLRVGEKYKTDIFADRAGHAIARTVNPQADGEDEANARRLVACWNACDEVSTEFLELLANFPDNQVKAYENLEAQRNELLKELESIANANPKNWDAPFNDTASFQAWAQSRASAAIAKVKGEKA
jgi:hypothetical protein